MVRFGRDIALSSALFALVLACSLFLLQPSLAFAHEAATQTASDSSGIIVAASSEDSTKDADCAHGLAPSNSAPGESSSEPEQGTLPPDAAHESPSLDEPDQAAAEYPDSPRENESSRIEDTTPEWSEFRPPERHIPDGCGPVDDANHRASWNTCEPPADKDAFEEAARLLKFAVTRYGAVELSCDDGSDSTGQDFGGTTLGATGQMRESSPGSAQKSRGLLIVGWDDQIAADRLSAADSTTPPDGGAWLAQESHDSADLSSSPTIASTTFGTNSLFWLSYFELSTGTMLASAQKQLGSATPTLTRVTLGNSANDTDATSGLHSVGATDTADEASSLELFDSAIAQLLAGSGSPARFAAISAQSYQSLGAGLACSGDSSPGVASSALADFGENVADSISAGISAATAITFLHVPPLPLEFSFAVVPWLAVLLLGLLDLALVGVAFGITRRP